MPDTREDNKLEQDKPNRASSQRFPVKGSAFPYIKESVRAVLKPDKYKRIAQKSEYFLERSLERTRGQTFSDKTDYLPGGKNNKNFQPLGQDKKMNNEEGDESKENNNSSMEKKSLIKKVVDFFKIKKKKSIPPVSTSYSELEPAEVVERSNRILARQKLRRQRKKVTNNVYKKAKSTCYGNRSVEPGSITEMVPFNGYNFNEGYNKLVQQVKEDNEKINLLMVKCNCPCQIGDIIVDKNKNITFIFKRSPLLNLLLYQDEIVRFNGENIEVEGDELSLPVESCQNVDLLIRRRGRSTAVPFKRQSHINLDMEYGYFYFVVTVPRIKKHAIGIEFHNTPADGVIIQNVIENTVGYYLFSQGDYICDINGVSIKTAEEANKMINEDETTFPTFSCVIKRSSAKSTQLKVVKNLFDNPMVVMRGDVLAIAKREENKLLRNDMKKKKNKTVLKNTALVETYSDKVSKRKSILKKLDKAKSEKSTMTCQPTQYTSKIKSCAIKIQEKPKTCEVQSDIENVVFANPVPKKMTFDERII
uniref:PDZ domain-containing protein n=1 Tax=Parastrongyloides trichosuri TaxID=131310 RepID=A0A0N4ZXZ2_PARTI